MSKEMPEWLVKEAVKFSEESNIGIGALDVGACFHECFDLMIEHIKNERHIWEETKKANKRMSQNYLEIKKRMKPRPIETAPQGEDDTFLVLKDGAWFTSIGTFGGTKGRFYIIDQQGREDVIQPTHWLPLPSNEVI